MLVFHCTLFCLFTITWPSYHLWSSLTGFTTGLSHQWLRYMFRREEMASFDWMKIARCCWIPLSEQTTWGFPGSEECSYLGTLIWSRWPKVHRQMSLPEFWLSLFELQTSNLKQKSNILLLWETVYCLLFTLTVLKPHFHEEGFTSNLVWWEVQNI